MKKVFWYSLLGGLLVAGSIFVWLSIKDTQEGAGGISKAVTKPLDSIGQMVHPSPTLPPPDPLSIDGLRQTVIAPSELRIDDTYQNNGNYTSYLASYTANGPRIKALLTVPNAAPPTGGFPAIVFLHGYIPPQQYQTTERYVEYVHYLASRGFVVLKIDYRGHGDSEGEPSGAYFSPNYVIDTLSAVKALQSYEEVNPEKIGIWGHSMSGNIALRSAVVSPAVKAVVIWAGAVFSYDDFEKYRLNDASYDPSQRSRSSRGSSRQLFEEYGNPSEGNPFWHTIAPTNYLESLSASVQLHHAENDTVVNPGYSEDLASMLDAANKEYEFYLYGSGGHNLSGGTFSTAMSRTAAFFQEKL